MGAVHLHWLNRTSETAYPVDDAATGVDNAGLRLPPDLIADLTLRWPATLGQRAFVSAASVTPGLVSLVIRAAAGPDDMSGSGPLAVIAVPRPVIVGKGYAFQAQAAGVSGWVVFGPGAENLYQGRFAGPSQSRLTARAARSYRPAAVSGLQAGTAAAPLSGLVALKADPPLEITHETREIAGIMRECAVIRLVEAPAGQPSVFEQFAGPCAGRPESNTCGDPQPIQYVNGVGADCAGVLTVMFTGCAAITPLAAGVAIDCGLGLAAACLPQAIPDADGLLPNEYPPILLPGAGSETSAAPVGEDFPLVLESLPWLDCFTAGVPDDIQPVAGEWEWTPDPSPTVCGSASVSYSVSDSMSVSVDEVWTGGSFEAQSAASRNVSLWSPSSLSTNRTTTADVKMLAGPSGAKHNASLILNYQPHPTQAGQVIYYAVTLDYDAQVLRIARFTGTSFVSLADSPLSAISLDTWYTLTATVVPGPDVEQTTITASVQVSTGPDLATLSVVTAAYAPSTGQVGFGTDHSLARFGYFSIDAAG